jgi:hypothetical protein
MALVGYADLDLQEAQTAALIVILAGIIEAACCPLPCS